VMRCPHRRFPGSHQREECERAARVSPNALCAGSDAMPFNAVLLADCFRQVPAPWRARARV